MNNTPVILTIAGFDPSSGAGVTADLKTIAAHDCYGVACITALTVQSTQGVRDIQALPAALIRAILNELQRDFDISAIKIGMLANAEICDAVADFVSDAKLPTVVLDPVLVSSSGAPLLDGSALPRLRTRLVPLVSVITPNASEAFALTAESDLLSAGERLLQLGASAVIITDGERRPPTDTLFTRDAPPQAFTGEHIPTRSTHGTGCAFSTAIACHLAVGVALPEAVAQSKHYVTEALRHARPLGKGNGPLEHSWKNFVDRA
jgi:hydroxymethylpyrimidine/phosphomethylpyrimidine kinase